MLMDSLIKGNEITKKEIPMQSSLVAPLVYAESELGLTVSTYVFIR